MSEKEIEELIIDAYNLVVSGKVNEAIFKTEEGFRVYAYKVREKVRIDIK